MSSYLDSNLDNDSQDQNLDEQEQLPKQKQPPAAHSGIDIDAPAEEAPTDQEYQTVLNRIKAARSAASSPVDLNKFDQQAQEAKQLYQDRATRAEWLSVADRIGQAVARYGAAQYGLSHGVDLSHVDMGPEHDWGKDQDRYQRDYSQDLTGINESRNAALKQQGEDYGLGERALSTMEQDRRLRSQEARADSRQTAADKRAAEREAQSSARQDKTLQNQNQMQDTRLKQQSEMEDTREQKREERLNKRSTVQDLDKQMLEAQKEYQAAAALGNNLQNEEDIGKKSRDKLKEKYGDLAGKAGVTPDQLEQIQTQSQDTGVAGSGLFKSTDKQKRNSLYQQQVLSPLKQKLESLRTQKENLLNSGEKSQINKTSVGTQGSAPSAPADSIGTAPASPELVRVRGPSGSVASMTKEAAQKYLSKPGYALVP